MRVSEHKEGTEAELAGVISIGVQDVFPEVESEVEVMLRGPARGSRIV